MADNDKKYKKEDLDAFWNLSSLIPKKEQPHFSSKRISPINIEISPAVKKENASDSSTVIKKYIDPMHYEHKKLQKASYETSECYIPQGALLHKVTLKKKKTALELYTDFYETALKYTNIEAEAAEYISYYSYVPQYDQLNDGQLKYYFWWRKCFNEGVLIKTDISYVLLYAYELINIGDKQDVGLAQKRLAELWNCYHKDFPALVGKLAIWICDFSLLHRLMPPENIKSSVIRYTPSLKEFFIHFPNNDLDTCTRSLLKYGTEYDYRTSRYATEKHIDIFDRHIYGAVRTAVEFFSKDGKILSELVSEDSKLIRNAFEGALCTSVWKYELEIKYCSFSRSNELRFIMGDIVKYAENKIRAFIGVKSRLSVYSISTELQAVLNEYFDTAFEHETPVVQKKLEEKHDYDKLYDLPTIPLSIENAKKIENESWSTTNELVSAFEEEIEEHIIPDIIPEETIPEEVKDDKELRVSLGKYLDFVLAVMYDDKIKISEISDSLGMLPEAVVDTVNEIAADTIGDILIEDGVDGFELIECYKDMI